MVQTRFDSKSDKQIYWSKQTIINSIASVFLAIILIVFSFIRTGLTAYTFSTASLGFLTIVVGILPYFSSSHSGLNSVSTFDLIKPFFHHQNHFKNKHVINQKIANLRPQYYSFGIIYLLLTIIIAFAFPFIFNQSGTINIEGQNSILWYESTLYILSNCVEIWTTYFFFPISILLLFIANKSYVYNLFNIALTILLNVILIILFIAVNNHWVDLSFVEMSIIMFCVLGVKTAILLFILLPFRKHYFPWYQKLKSSRILPTKNTFMAILSQYLSQFSSDIISIAFIVYAAVETNHNQADVPSLYHAGHGSSVGNSDFLPSAIFSVYLLLISSAREVVHSIVDAAIPSMAEHITINRQRIDKHFFHRYQLLTTYITCYAITTFLMTISFSNGLFLEQDHAATDHIHVDFNWILSLGLCIPIFIESVSATYDHLLPIFGKFKDILKINLVKTAINIVLLVIFSCAICLSNPDFVMDGLFISIIISWTFANLCVYFWSRKIVASYIATSDECGNLFLSTALSYIYVFVIFIALTPVFIVYSHNINHYMEGIKPLIKVLIIVSISLLNLVLCYLNILCFRRNDVLFYHESFKKSQKTSKKMNKISKF